MPTVHPGVSIIVPAYREVDNLRPLVERISVAAATVPGEFEIIIVDDHSQDGTEELVAELAARYPVRLIVRRSERGLATAVLAGFREARFDRFVVLDADLQHPPEAIPALIHKISGDGCDFAIGTRYGGDGGIEEGWPWTRRFASWFATQLARPLVRLSDPMSGFFALPRSTWERATGLDPIGYKIALELYVKGRCQQPAEVPIRFAERAAGETKFGFKEVRRYLVHLVRLYWFRFPWAVTALAAVLGIALALLLFEWVFRPAL